MLAEITQAVDDPVTGSVDHEPWLLVQKYTRVAKW